MHGFDDLAVVDALQVDRGDAEVAVAALTLDDDQRHAFAGELDGVRVPELVRRDPPTDAGRDGGPAQLRSGGPHWPSAGLAWVRSGMPPGLGAGPRRR
jgi:hypothetical protein